ncbi:hypothetical protein LINPERPRIM_LOCUS21710 [Linum perenne]
MMFSANRSRKKQQPRQSICLSISKLQFGGNLMEKRRAFDIVKDHLFPPPVKKLVSSTRKHERTIERNCMHHLEFVRICEEVNSKSEEGNWVAETLDNSRPNLHNFEVFNSSCKFSGTRVRPGPTLTELWDTGHYPRQTRDLQNSLQATRNPVNTGWANQAIENCHP